GIIVPMDEQLDSFERTIKWHLPLNMNKSEIPHHVSKSIYLISIGNNDYLINYLGSVIGHSITSSIFKPDVFAQLLIHTLSKQLQFLSDLPHQKRIILCSVGELFVQVQVKDVLIQSGLHKMRKVWAYKEILFWWSKFGKGLRSR
ncbi:hypothetical protein PIB30_083656, partial [Stylosanthes scabra]|nr:hypothetical protein [Stylosanthes scabra]